MKNKNTCSRPQALEKCINLLHSTLDTRKLNKWFVNSICSIQCLILVYRLQFLKKEDLTILGPQLEESIGFISYFRINRQSRTERSIHNDTNTLQHTLVRGVTLNMMTLAKIVKEVNMTQYIGETTAVLNVSSACIHESPKREGEEYHR